MKIKTLIKLLKEFDENKQIFFANDSEGDIIYGNCFVDMDKDKIVVYPYGGEFKRLGEMNENKS